MKRLLFITGIVLFLAASLHLTVSVVDAQYSSSNYHQIGGARFVVGGDIDIIDGGEIDIEDGGIFFMEPTDDRPTAEEGYIYFDDSDNALTFHNGSGWVVMGVGTGDNTLDAAYDQPTGGAGKAIDVDSGAVALTAGNADDNIVFAIVQQDTGGTTAMTITGSQASANAISLDIDAQTTGRDIEGTGASWYVTGAGVLTTVSAVIPTLTVNTAFNLGATFSLANGETIIGDTAHEIQFGDNTADYEDISFVFGNNNNIITLATDTGADAFAFGVVDDLTGVGSVAMDAAAASITLTADGANEDFTVAMDGGVNASLILSSAGTAADALQISTSAGGIQITNGGASAEDLLIDGVLSAVGINSDEATVDAIDISASGGGITMTSSTVATTPMISPTLMSKASSASGTAINAKNRIKRIWISYLERANQPKNGSL